MTSAGASAGNSSCTAPLSRSVRCAVRAIGTPADRPVDPAGACNHHGRVTSTRPAEDHPLTKTLFLVLVSVLVTVLAVGCGGSTTTSTPASTGTHPAGAYIPPLGMDEEDTAKSLYTFLVGKGMDVADFGADDGDPNAIQLSGWKTFVFRYEGEDEFIEIAPSTQALLAWVAKAQNAHEVAVTFGSDSTIMFYPNGNRGNAEGYKAATDAAQRVADLADGKLIA